MASRGAPTKYRQRGPLTTANGGFKDADGNDFYFHGISWFGFDGVDGMVGGLDKDSSNFPCLNTTMVRDWELVAKRIKLLGFNAIRLPFSFAYIMPDPDVKSDMAGKPMPQVASYCDGMVARTGCTISGFNDIANNLTPPAGSWAVPIAADFRQDEEAKFLLGSLPATGGGTATANLSLPKSSFNSSGLRNVLDRFLHVIQGLVEIGFYVILDCQLQQDPLTQFLMTSGKSGDWDKWAGLWGSLITNVLALPATSAGSSIIDYIIVDVMNEPECSDGDKGNYNIDLKWSAHNSTSTNKLIPGMEDIYIKAMETIFSLSKGTLFFVEGTDGKALNWGDGFRLNNPQGTSPQNFFDNVAKEPYASNVVISPHVYPSSVNQYAWDWNTGQVNPTAVPKLLAQGSSGGDSLLFQTLDNTFGYLMSPYTTKSGQTIHFPLCIGETGTAFVKSLPGGEIQQRGAGDSTMDKGHPWSTLSNDANIHFYPEWDPAYMEQLQEYTHIRKIKNCFWWSFNADSGDTGGIVASDPYTWIQHWPPQGSLNKVLPKQGQPWSDVNWDIIAYMSATVGLRPWFA